MIDSKVEVQYLDVVLVVTASRKWQYREQLLVVRKYVN